MPAIESTAETMVATPNVNEANVDKPKIDQPEIEAIKEALQVAGQYVEIDAESTEQTENKLVNEPIVEEDPVLADSTAEQEFANKETQRPAPEDIPDSKDNDDDVHLGAESTPSVDTELHKTPPSVH
jgi:hypothetical protein